MGRLCFARARQFQIGDKLEKIKDSSQNPDSNQFLPKIILNLPLFSGQSSAEKEQQIQNYVGEELIESGLLYKNLKDLTLIQILFPTMQVI